MNRRDIIIVAALINAGLLIVLFVTGLKSDNSSSEISVQQPSAEQFFSAEHSNSLSSSAPAFDFGAAPSSSGVEAVKDAAAPESAFLAQAPSVPSGTEAVSMNFANDLNLFSTPADGSQSPANALSQAPTPSSSPESQYVEVTVKKGDVLEKIARQHKTTVSEIMKANQLASARLKIGQVLKVPAGKKGASSEASKPLTASGEAKYYTVKNGDNPWTIAVKNRIKVEDLLKLNNLNEEKARKLKPGDKLRIQ